MISKPVHFERYKYYISPFMIESFNKKSYKEKCEHFCLLTLNKCKNENMINEYIRELKDILSHFNDENIDEVKHTDLLADIIYNYIKGTPEPAISALIRYDLRMYRIVVENFQNDFDSNWENETFRNAYVIVVPQTMYPNNLTEVQETFLVISLAKINGSYNKRRVEYLYHRLQDNLKELCEVNKAGLGYYQISLGRIKMEDETL